MSVDERQGRGGEEEGGEGGGITSTRPARCSVAKAHQQLTMESPLSASIGDTYLLHGHYTLF